MSQNRHNIQNQISYVTGYIFENIAVTRNVSERADFDVQVVFCHEAITGPQHLNGKLYLYCSTIPPLHWDALGATRLPCKVSV